MNTFTNNGGTFKSGMRSIALSHGNTGQVLKVILLLPGPNLTCVKEALWRGLIDRTTFVIAVEKDAATAKIIEAFLKAKFARYHIHASNIYSLDLKGMLTFYGLREIDFAYVDLCGQLTDKVLMWIREELCHFCSKMAFTFSTHIRSNNLIQKELIKYLYGPWSWTWTKKRFEKMCKVAMATGNFHLVRNDVYQKTTAYGLSLALRDGLNIEGWIPYRDQRTSMVLAVVGGVRECDTECIACDTDTECIAKSINYSPVTRWFAHSARQLSPAQRAWQTRRQRAAS